MGEFKILFYCFAIIVFISLEAFCLLQMNKFLESDFFHIFFAVQKQPTIKYFFYVHTYFSNFKKQFTSDVRCILGIFDLPAYPNQILYYISLFSKIRCSLTYLPKNLTLYVNAPLSNLAPIFRMKFLMMNMKMQRPFVKYLEMLFFYSFEMLSFF